MGVNIGDIPAATSEDVDIAVEAARKALARNKGKDWASATGAHRAKYLRAIAAKVFAFLDIIALFESCFINLIWVIGEAEAFNSISML